uniref:Uncharacterized protein n=1 Tax=Piliocolobus tephrosceles TaxID=591936 RepID=A0A8C9GGA6_9PRIM
MGNGEGEGAGGKAGERRRKQGSISCPACWHICVPDLELSAVCGHLCLSSESWALIHPRIHGRSHYNGWARGAGLGIRPIRLNITSGIPRQVICASFLIYRMGQHKDPFLVDRGFILLRKASHLFCFILILLGETSWWAANHCASTP